MVIGRLNLDQAFDRAKWENGAADQDELIPLLNGTKAEKEVYSPYKHCKDLRVNHVNLVEKFKSTPCLLGRNPKPLVASLGFHPLITRPWLIKLLVQSNIVGQ